MWFLKGYEALVSISRTGRKKIMYYGAYSPQNQFLYVENVLEETSEMTASFFISLRAKFPHRRLDIVLDNAPWHYGADVKRIIKIYNLHLHYLPSYSPDLNLIEPLWLWARQEKTYNFDYSSIQEKANNLEIFFQEVSSRPQELKKRLVKKFKI